jgi:hypothetical protein
VVDGWCGKRSLLLRTESFARRANERLEAGGAEVLDCEGVCGGPNTTCESWTSCEVCRRFDLKSFSCFDFGSGSRPCQATCSAGPFDPYVPTKLLKGGEVCVYGWNADLCKPGTYCTYAPMETGTCRRSDKHAGETCTDLLDCVDGLTCVGWQLPGVCQPWSDIGGPCVPSGLDGCAKPLACDQATNKCFLPNIPLLTSPCAGGTCHFQAGLGGACVDKLDCQALLVCKAGVCGTDATQCD